MDNLHEHLLAGTDPIVILSEAFARQAHTYADAAARATVTVARLAVRHLYAASGEPAVIAFLSGLERQEETKEPSA